MIQEYIQFKPRQRYHIRIDFGKKTLCGRMIRERKWRPKTDLKLPVGCETCNSRLSALVVSGGPT